jgi:DsbC/DsbD-like thiol-disulfide interchange protein
MMKKITARFPIIATLACLAAQVSHAQDIPDNVLRAEFRSGWQTDSGTQMAALHLTLAPGWKTYWRAPGESGIPPQFDWSGSENIASATFHWPKPEIFDLNGLRTIGYENELVLPIELHPIKAGAPMIAMAEVELGVCEEVCIPMTVDLSQALSPTTKQDPVIRAALSQVPEPAASAGLSAAKCSVEPIRDGMRLTSDLTLPRLGPAEFVVIELTDQAVWVSTAQTSRSGGLLTSVADLVPPNAQPFALDRSDIRITVFGGAGRIIDLQGCPG